MFAGIFKLIAQQYSLKVIAIYVKRARTVCLCYRITMRIVLWHKQFANATLVEADFP